MKRKTSELVRLKNDENLMANVIAWRTVAKAAGFIIRFYGRCADKKSAFKLTKRHHSIHANSNDITLSSKEAKYCYEFVGYKR
jgi:hypothetical protein